MGRYDELELQNKKTYLKPPTVEQINSFIKELNVTAAQFENFYSIPKGTIKVVRTGFRKLPPRWWNVVYERIVPTYGSNNNNKSVYKKYAKPVVIRTVIHDKDEYKPDRLITL